MDSDTRQREEAGEPVVLRDDERVPWVHFSQGVRAGEEGLAQSIDVTEQVYMMTYAISSGLACFAEAEVERLVGERSRGEQGL